MSKIHTIILDEYSAQSLDGPLEFGTEDSYGIEQIQISAGPEWDGLVITAAFSCEGTLLAPPIVVPESGLFDVPPGATSQTMSALKPGIIVFAGTSDGVQRISTNIAYRVEGHGPFTGDAPDPTPSEWAQFVAQVQDSATAAAQSAASASASAEEAQQAGSQAVQEITEAKTNALNQISSAQQTAETAIGNAQNTGVQAVQAAQETAVEAVQEAQTEAEQAIQDLVPDVYTKAESDARYAPIESAIMVSGQGDGLANLQNTCAWYMQWLKLYGNTTQDGTPTPENPVSLVSAGDGGSVDVTVCGKNLCPDFEVSTNKYNSILNKTAYGSVYESLEKAIIPGNQYRLSATVIYDGQEYNGDFYIGIAYEGGKFITIYASKNTTFSASGIADKIQYIYYYAGPNIVDGKTRSVKNLMLIAGTENLPSYQPYQSQSLLIPTPNGLPGIPVTNGGNYTDDTGQQRICDVVDFEAKTLTQYCQEIASYNGEEITTPYISSTGALTTGAQVIYALSTPITTPLSDETLATYKTLQSYQGQTNVIAADCGIEATAVGDGTAIIADLSSRLAALESAQTEI